MVVNKIHFRGHVNFCMLLLTVVCGLGIWNLHSLTSELMVPPFLEVFLDSLVVECWLRMQEVSGLVPSVSFAHYTKDV